MNDKLIKDIMIQKYQFNNFYDPTKLFIILALLEEGSFYKSYSIYDISKYVYRYYISNIEITKYNFNSVVRNIRKYGVEDIVPLVSSTIKQWIKEQKYNSINILNDQIFLNIDDYSNKAVSTVKTVCKTLFFKYYKVQLKPIKNYKEILEIDDTKIDKIGISSIKELVFEDMQYCPLCEETDPNKLFVTHILLNSETDNAEDGINKDNLLLLCENEFEDYIKGLFYFDELGRVINNGSKCVNNKMRLSQKILNSERKMFIKRHYEIFVKR